jgi:hypothetical protein
VRSRRSTWIGASVFAVVAMAATAISASARPEAAHNLLKNGGAEVGPGSSDVRTAVKAIPGWEAAIDDRGGQFNVLVYKSISPKDAQRGNFWPSTAASRLIKGGKKLFYGGYIAPGKTSSTLTQTVDVAAQAKAIDAGKLSATLAAAIGGVGNTKDTLTVVAGFHDASGKRLGLIRIGPVPREQWDKVFSNRGHSTALLERSGTKNVPKGTRSILVVLQTIKRDGANSDAIADNISLTLGPSQ